jgi:hypothetical protein
MCGTWKWDAQPHLLFIHFTSEDQQQLSKCDSFVIGLSVSLIFQFCVAINFVSLCYDFKEITPKLYRTNRGLNTWHGFIRER